MGTSQKSLLSQPHVPLMHQDEYYVAHTFYSAQHILLSSVLLLLCHDCLFLLPFKGSVGWMVTRLLCIQRHNACKNSGSRRHIYMSTKCACATKQRNPLFSFIILLISSALSAASRVVVVASISTDLSYGVDSVTLLVREEEYYVVNFVLSVVRLAFAFSSPIIVFSGHHAAPI